MARNNTNIVIFVLYQYDKQHGYFTKLNQLLPD